MFYGRSWSNKHDSVGSLVGGGASPAPLLDRHSSTGDSEFQHPNITDVLLQGEGLEEPRPSHVQRDQRDERRERQNLVETSVGGSCALESWHGWVGGVYIATFNGGGLIKRALTC